MPDRSVAFLRSINVGGRRVTNDQLAAAFGDLGLDEVATFLASGNVLFAAPQDHEASHQADLEARISTGLETALGFEVPVTIRSAAELRALDEAEPFTPEELAASAGKIQVMLLFDEVDPSIQLAVDEVASAVPDHVAFGPRALFWLPPAGMSESEIDLVAITRLVGQNTVRTANTIRRLVAKG
ncbi:MAG: DUF1697 domain-containing protein [Actinomycetota bacterium]